MEIVTKSARETFNLGQKLANNLKTGGVVALYGELGSGKTTFVQGLARGLRIKKRIISPTFIFIRSYTLYHKPYTLYHVDLYRIERLEDIRGLGLEEILADPRNIVAIEWAERIKGILPKKRIDIRFKYIDENTREIHFNPLKEYSEMKNLGKALEIIRNGGIIIFPTDTAFGVGCRMDDKKAVERLFKIRQRPETQAVPVLVDSIEMAQKYLQPIPDDVKLLMEKYWPGALTIVLLCKIAVVPSLVRGGGQTLGVRMPNHQVPLSIINSIGVPILGPSANFHSKPTPYKLEDLDKEFLKMVDYVIPGNCPLGMVSTVIDCSGKPWKILREGGIKIHFNTLK